ncbi:hypothetical protein CXG81DRAFT_9757 [Caulochytrium protostelioides]|uniref:Ubiquitin-activating enzyme E1 1 n=1 Tax=Caulochytrium protostelioides TaxID=1555241 RepID=A0A4P9XCR8_9FUNG|nr:ubiquitin-activating enzyme E1 [Caulochytrium protostelioides]RKP03257.1 hypothetical protein CXG81DRAFT_9757 [Caulochytrium protostelioides]|eukprot:RKP03257.1 hypothetical protein CXG81DRAFT_9757 [Caulochytrium protostelioides]
MEVERRSSAPAIDESLYSRQLYVLGHEAMKRMGFSNVLIVGLDGLGVEIAKNVILAGVKSVSLYDMKPTEVADLGSQFYLSDADIGQPRAQAARERLAELNAYVSVAVVTELPDAASIRRWDVVVAVGQPLSLQLELDEMARAAGAKFIAAETRGLFSSCFVDFGEGFHVHDQDGEEPLTGLIASITEDDDGCVTTFEETRHGLETGDLVTFVEVQGMTGLNNSEPRKVTVKGPYTFTIGSTKNLGGAYKTGGYFRQVKAGKTFDFKPLRQSLMAPEFLVSDFSKFDRPAQLHVGFQALNAYQQTKQALPRPQNADDAEELLRLAKDIAQRQTDPVVVDEKLLTQLAYQARGDLPPMNAFMGGLVAQEILKACSGKFNPIVQWLYFDSLESLPAAPLTEADCQPRHSRYDRQIAVFGAAFHAKLQNTKEFLVGAGAIGCEMLKNWALMGLGTGEHGAIFITDMDTIEKSNLNRQFLFRPKDVGALKSAAAAAAVTVMNPALTGKITVHAERVGADTETIFDESFWHALDGVTNALDNVEARKYVDWRCVYFRKPLLESGTLGTKGNTQVVVPHLTESYSSSSDPPEKSIPICTLKNFPNAIEHTIQWARDTFEGLFLQGAENANLFLSQGRSYLDSLVKQGGGSTQIEIMEGIKANLLTHRAHTFEDCVAWARLRFEEYFANQIKQLLYNFPPDAVTSTGAAFWSGPKRAPTPLQFDASNPLHLDFIVNAANIRAYNFGIPAVRDAAQVAAMVASVAVPAFQPKTNVKIHVNDAEAAKDADPSDDDRIHGLISELEKVSVPPGGYTLHPAKFEKDDDTNFHIDFVTAASNLRASNYAIAVADRHKTKFIAGKIIPAIATTTALVTGLVCLELYKIIDGKKDIEAYKNGFINLSLPLIAFSEPIRAPEYKYNDKTWTLWDRFDLDGDLTLQALLDHFQNEHGLEITMMSCNAVLLYSFFMPIKKRKERLGMTMVQIYEQVSKKPLPAGLPALTLELCCNDRTGEDVEVPSVRLALQ